MKACTITAFFDEIKEIYFMIINDKISQIVHENADCFLLLFVMA